MSQFPEMVSGIMMGNENLKTAYQSLLTTSTVTIAFAFFLLVDTLDAGDITPLAGVLAFLTGGLIYLLPDRYGVIGVTTGATGVFAHMFLSPSPIPVPLVLPALVVTTALTGIAMTYLMKHAVIIASLLWEKDVNGELENPEANTEETSAT